MSNLTDRLRSNDRDVMCKACRPAADALEVQAKRIAELKDEVLILTGKLGFCETLVTAAEARIAELEEEATAQCERRIEQYNRAERAEADLAAARAALLPRPESEWHEDMGDVLWFHFPIQEPPWVGTPLTSTWIEGWYTHFLPLPNFNAVHDAIVAALGITAARLSAMENGRADPAMLEDLT